MAYKEKIHKIYDRAKYEAGAIKQGFERTGPARKKFAENISSGISHMESGVTGYKGTLSDVPTFGLGEGIREKRREGTQTKYVIMKGKAYPIASNKKKKQVKRNENYTFGGYGLNMDVDWW